MPFLFLVLCICCLSCQSTSYSKVVLDDYLLLSQNIQQQNHLIRHATFSQLAYFEEQALNKPILQIFSQKAHKAIKLSSKLKGYIDKLQERLIVESGGWYTEEEALALSMPDLKHQIKNLDDYNSVHQILLSSQDSSTQPLAQFLVEEIQILQTDYLELIANLWENGGIKGTIFYDRSKKALSLKSLKAELAFDGYNNHWATASFDQKPLAAVLSILSKLQSDITISEAAIVHFLISQFSITPLHYDKFDVLAQSAKPHIRLGEQYESEIALGTYASTTPFKVMVNGKTLDMIDGKAQYKVTPSTIGTQKYEAKIAVFNEMTQQTSIFTKEFHFEVIP